MIYRLVRNAFGAGSIHYLGKWEGVGALEIECILGPKKSRFPGPNPLLLAQIMVAALIKSITHGAL